MNDLILEATVWAPSTMNPPYSFPDRTFILIEKMMILIPATFDPKYPRSYDSFRSHLRHFFG
jgi:hypothetical protein